MVNSALLEERIKAAGYGIAEFADLVGISRAAFYLKKKNQREFKGREISKICEVLNLDIYDKDKIFFAGNVA